MIDRLDDFLDEQAKRENRDVRARKYLASARPPADDPHRVRNLWCFAIGGGIGLGLTTAALYWFTR